MTFKINNLFITIALVLNSCSPFENNATEYEPNSQDAQKVIVSIIEHEFLPNESIKNFYVYENRTGLDPFYYLRFSLEEADFFNVFDSTWTFSTSSSNFFLPSDIPSNRRNLFNIPNWYNPTIDSTSLFFLKEFPGGSKSGMYSQKTETCFVFYSTY